MSKPLSYIDNLIFGNKTSSHNLQIDSLDGLRGVAVLFVLLSHTSNAGIRLPFLNFSGSGKYGVYLFFVLSSFLLTLPFLNKKEDELGSAGLWRSYAVKRFLRIYPLYATVLLFHYLFTAAAGTTEIAFPFAPADLIKHLTLLEGKDLFWTIPVEFKYYFILPFVVLFMVRALGGRVWLAAASVIAATAAIRLIVPRLPEGAVDYLQFIPYMPIFLFGSFAAVAHSRLSGMRLPAGVKTVLELIAIGLMLGVWVVMPLGRSVLTADQVTQTHGFSKSFLIFGGLWMVFVIAYLHGAGYVKRFLSWKPMRLIGMISFSVYLWHLPVVKAVDTYVNAGSAIKMLVILTVTFAVSFSSYLIIERPMSRAGLRKKQPRASVAAS
ncbi:MAG: acyltransferase [Deltaproteobacteria bacterium]|nr:acyltransferase [Deltaproteobacteria bacterium]